MKQLKGYKKIGEAVVKDLGRLALLQLLIIAFVIKQT